MEQAKEAPLTVGTGTTEATDKNRPFRVIIAGAGVAGLAFSHALLRAGIDHIVLEKGVVAPDWGASISLWGNGSRILSQIGCLDALEADALPLKVLHVRGPDGKAFSEEAFFDMMRERNGFEAITMERRNFLQIVYDQLPDKSKILTKRRVVDVVDNEDGVMVKLADGTTEHGDILIGCDGVHSTVRELMWRNANSSIPNHITAQEKTSLVTTYNSLVGVAKTIPGLGVRDMHWVCRRGLSFLILTQPDQTYFFVNWKMPQKMRWPTKAKWSAEETERAAASIVDIPISESAVFGELWKHKKRAHLIGLEEGTFDHWHFGRIALVGDSVHKVTPNFALGANCALESSVALINGINRLYKSLEPGKRPSKAAISAMFQRYQEERKPRMRIASDASALLTRLQACDGNLNHFIMRYIFPVQGQASYADKLASLCCSAPKFDFLPVNYPNPSTFKWMDELEHEVTKPKGHLAIQGKLSSGGFAKVTSLLAAVFFIFILLCSNSGAHDNFR
ncbi:FAD binding domain-containing protein [Nannizzia gypsea CBS 118893]|uniref:FAD binding domain-containing protein n=1 Tax=Arthroderma gypseum (strain ATCC MYA-4604 / CBS 118893) TaxID=535722 RepID=E4UP73_ARTGP|nr:FAD binding domain-containing protein [Nannizzia gypsea CBS 118893]EFQ99799.1 FAD binding domain-containing protein [Nannizzia gypsea CBS 118893]